MPGKGPLHTFDTDIGRVGSALCYDYDFPALAGEHGRARVDVVALPSSDWRGIDPIHTQMATLRAIENGVSIVRSTRFGLSAAIDPYGRMLATQSAFDAKSDLLLSTLPPRRVPTLYARIGDVLILGCALMLLAVSSVWARALLSRRSGVCFSARCLAWPWSARARSAISTPAGEPRRPGLRGAG